MCFHPLWCAFCCGFYYSFFLCNFMTSISKQNDAHIKIDREKWKLQKKNKLLLNSILFAEELTVFLLCVCVLWSRWCLLFESMTSLRKPCKTSLCHFATQCKASTCCKSYCYYFIYFFPLRDMADALQGDGGSTPNERIDRHCNINSALFMCIRCSCYLSFSTSIEACSTLSRAK